MPIRPQIAVVAVRDSRGIAAPTLSAALYRFRAFNSQLLPMTIANAATPRPMARHQIQHVGPVQRQRRQAADQHYPRRW